MTTAKTYRTVDPRTVTPDLLLAYIEKRAEGADERVEDDAWIDGSGGIKWFRGDDLYCDDGTEFCFDCANKRLKAILKKYTKYKDELSIGCSNNQEHDSPPYCSVCGVKLACSLTDHGFESELEAITTYAKPTRPNDWAWLAEVLGNVRAGNDPLPNLVEHPVPKGQSAWENVPGGLEAQIHNTRVRTWHAIARAFL